MAIVVTIISSNLLECNSRESFGGNANTRVYEVVATILNGSAPVVVTELILATNYALAPNFAFPVRGVVHPYDASKVCSDVEIVWQPKSQGIGGAGGGIYIVTATYSTIIEGYRDISVSPLDREADVVVDDIEDMHTPDKDADGNFYFNSVRDIFPETPPIPRPGLERWDVTWNTQDLEGLRALRKTVNNATWNGASAGCVALEKLRAKLVTEDYQGETITYWMATITFTVSDDPTRLKDYLVDMGFNHFSMIGGPNKYKNLAPDKTEYLVPQYLDGKGSVSTSGEITVVTDPVFYGPTGIGSGFARYKSADWSSAPFPPFSFDTDITPS